MTSSAYRTWGKPLFDLVGATVALVLVSPILLVTAALVRILLGSPVLFRQIRPGRNGAPFELLKFRSMTDARDAQGCLLPDVERLTGFGRFLRSTSIDELPELWNIMRGKMSVVGPRPLLMDYLPRYSSEQARRHDVRPGLTGLAQVSGRNDTTWADRLARDVWYVDNLTLKLDAAILLRTVGRVLSRRGVSSADGLPMSPFEG